MQEATAATMMEPETGTRPTSPATDQGGITAPHAEAPESTGPSDTQKVLRAIELIYESGALLRSVRYADGDRVARVANEIEEGTASASELLVELAAETARRVCNGKHPPAEPASTITDD